MQIFLLYWLSKGSLFPAEKIEDVYHFSIGPLRIETIYAAFGEIYKGSYRQIQHKGDEYITRHNPAIELQATAFPTSA